MQAITTKYLGPTNFRGSRIKAYCQAGSITIPFDHSLSGEEVYAKAAWALCKKLGWNAERLTMGIDKHGKRIFLLNDSESFNKNLQSSYYAQ